jgi:rhodanese-related sulfurtransferase
MIGCGIIKGKSSEIERGEKRGRRMRKMIPILLSTLLFAGCGASNAKTGHYRRVSMDEAMRMMQEESGYIILDVRTPEEFAQGHIPNAVNLPNEEIGTEKISLLPNKNQMILVYCRSGRRSVEASEKLARLGYSNIVEFGGILDWRGEIVKEN